METAGVAATEVPRGGNGDGAIEHIGAQKEIDGSGNGNGRGKVTESAKIIPDTRRGTQRVLAETTQPVVSAKKIRENAESMEAREFFERYLAENVQIVQTLKEMEDIVREFRQCALIMLVWKCVDGRVHGSKGKGYPTGTILFARTEGANIDIDPKNTRLWEIINTVIADAQMRTTDMPAVVIILGHYAKSKPHRSCAAHGFNDEKALATVEVQIRKLREEYYDPKRAEPYSRDQVVFLHGMTNTDDMSETLYFEHGENIDSGALIAELTLQHPSDVFSETFLNESIHDPTTRKYVGTGTVRSFLEGSNAPMYRHLKTALAMETFLMRRIGEIVNRDGKGAEQILNRKVFDALFAQINGIKDLPVSLKGPLMYQFIWNIAYALYQRNRLQEMDAKEREQHLDHAEQLVCYGEGFETLTRNKALLVKPGRGDEIQALTTAKNVLLKYSPLKHMPMVHINIELTDKISSWDSYKMNVMAKLMRMRDNEEKIFGEKGHIMCTYSYKDEKQFYPVRVSRSDPREVMQTDITDAFASDTQYTPVNFSHREFDFTREMLRTGSKQE